jgi:OHCU decarboxylase
MFDPATSEYPRDLVGYGSQVPKVSWPGNARIAVQFVLNYEEGGENCILHGDAASEAFLSEIVGAQAWVGQRHMNMESIYEYGSRAGFWRLHRLFTERKLPVTVFGVATAMERNPEAVAAMKEARWEIATHGLKWIDYRDVSEIEEKRHIEESIAIHQRVTGARPLGMYQGRTSANTLRLTMEEGGFLYSSDSYADDLPFWIKGPQGPHLIVPYTLDANDMRFATPQGFNSGTQFYDYLHDSFDTLYDEGETNPKMMSIGLHCRLAGRPGRIASLKRFLDYIAKYDGVWVTTRLDIARHWTKFHAPVGGYKPSEMSKALFVECFGDVFEHTPEIAADAYTAGLDANADTARGLHTALVAAMRRLGTDQKRALIRAHPDLAGKLASASLLTGDSTREQQSAGLDKLTASERETFSKMNAYYVSRFEFPFIMAVKGRTKAEILAAFDERLHNAPEQEFETALREIEKIVLLRLNDRLP